MCIEYILGLECYNTAVLQLNNVFKKLINRLQTNGGIAQVHVPIKLLITRTVSPREIHLILEAYIKVYIFVFNLIG